MVVRLPAAAPASVIRKFYAHAKFLIASRVALDLGSQPMCSDVCRCTWVGGHCMRFLGVGVAAILLVSSATAQVSQIYTYGALVRPTKVTPSTGTAACYNHDPTDNRTTVTASDGCTFSGGGGGQNSPPQAVDVYVFIQSRESSWSGSLGVLFNDIDADLPSGTLSVTSVSGSSYATVQPSGSHDLPLHRLLQSGVRA